MWFSGLQGTRELWTHALQQMALSGNHREVSMVFVSGSHCWWNAARPPNSGC